MATDIYNFQEMFRGLLSLVPQVRRDERHPSRSEPRGVAGSRSLLRAEEAPGRRRMPGRSGFHQATVGLGGGVVNPLCLHLLS